MDMDKIIASLLVGVFSQLVAVSSFDLPRYFIPTQEQFVAQQSQAALLQHKSQQPSAYFSWPTTGQGTVGGIGNQATSVGSSANTNTASGFSYGPQGAGLIQQPQFFGGSFGLGFGFGSGWYYPINPFSLIPPNIQQQSQFQQQLQQHQQSLSSASAGFQAKPIDLQMYNPSVPIILKPSNTGWDTSYNVPCGTYRIKPFVVANLRLATGTSPFSNRRRKRSPFRFEYENADAQAAFSTHFQHERGFPSYFPPSPGNPVPIPNPPQSNREPKTCLWNFNSDGPCKLKFKCVWFQLPALLSCSENYMQVTDATHNLNSTFCGNRKPRKVYNSSSGKLILTFRSHTSSLPAVFDCAVTCTLAEASSNEQKPNRKIIVASSNYNFIQTKDFNFTTSTEQESFAAESDSTDIKNILSVTEKHRIRIGDCKCGVQDDQYLSKGRIVGGSPATPVEFPWTVALVRKSSSVSSRSSVPFCSGSLISDRYLVSAAHCVTNNKIIREPRSVAGKGVKSPEELFDVLLIEHDVNRLDEVPGGSLRIAVDKIIVHPQYDNITFNYDVALIRLQRPVDFTTQSDFYRHGSFDFRSQRRRFIPEVEVRHELPRPTPRPICLPPDKDTVLQDKYATITGWGLQHEGGVPSDELMKATVQIFNDSLCKEIYKEYNYPVTDSMMCAGYMAGKVDACVGDSGGGLIVKEDGKYFLGGITSWGRGCGRIKQPGVYTKITGIMDWIKSEASDGIWCI